MAHGCHDPLLDVGALSGRNERAVTGVRRDDESHLNDASPCRSVESGSGWKRRSTWQGSCWQRPTPLRGHRGSRAKAARVGEQPSTRRSNVLGATSRRSPSLRRQRRVHHRRFPGQRGRCELQPGCQLDGRAPWQGARRPPNPRAGRPGSTEGRGLSPARRLNFVRQSLTIAPDTVAGGPGCQPTDI